MNILIVNSHYYPEQVGGAEISCQKLAEHLAKQPGHRVSVLCSAHVDECSTHNEVDVYRIKTKRDVARKGLLRYIETMLSSFINISAYRKSKRILREIRPDVIHTNNLYGISPLIWLAARQLNIPVVHTSRDYHLCAQRVYGRLMSKMVKIATAPSNYMTEYFQAKGLFANARVTQTVYNAIEFNMHRIDDDYMARQTADKQTVDFVFAGRLEPEKGILWLLDVFSSADCPKDVALHIYGKGSCAGEIEAYAGISAGRIIYHGFLSQKDLHAALPLHDVMLAPSLWNEPFGRMVLDGYAHGMPAIVTNNGGLPELVEHETGIIVSGGDNSALLAAINYYAEPGVLHKSIEPIKKTLSRFSIAKQAREFLDLYGFAVSVDSTCRK